MKIELFDRHDQLQAVLDDETKMLGFYPVQEFWRLNVRCMWARGCSDI